MKVALFGGTGFVGSYIVDELVSREHQPRLMVRLGSEGKVPKPEYCETVSGDIHDDYAIRETLYDCDAAIYLIAVIKEFPKEGITNELLQFRGAQRVANISLEVGVKRFLLMSALGTNCGPGASKYFKAKHLAEQAVKNTELSWTILRPSSIFGDPRGFERPEFCTMLKKDMLNLIPFPGFLPFPAPSFYTGLNPFNAGSFSLSMIHAADVATLFANVLEDDTTIGKTL
ncbi:MAG: NAD(P)H-binding protein, partial [Candidatus Marinimicrobia bacterium]|nr:NAD(P)H-binding protein [Candidatus Neomarinimicrobiota bacterium]